MRRKIKFVILTIISCVTVLFATSCADTAYCLTDYKFGNLYFQKVESIVFREINTNMIYLIYNGRGISPVYNADGSLMTFDDYSKLNNIIVTEDCKNE
jgi:hypothetical protein